MVHYFEAQRNNLLYYVCSRNTMRKITLTQSPQAIGIHSYSLPVTVTLTSSDVGKLLELSTDDGITYFTPVLEIDEVAQSVLTIAAPVTHVRATGALGDVVTVVGGANGFS